MASTSTSASRQPGSSPGQGQTETKAPLIAYNNVLVLLPPREVAHRLNPFRAVHDKAGIRWTAHITLLFPFVADSHLQSTLDILRPLVATVKPFKLTLDGVDRFSKPSGDTVHLTAGKKNKEENDNVQRLWKIVSGACGYKGRPFVPHMTLGQAPNQGRDIEALQFLNQKADSIWRSVKDIEWIVGSVAVLKKDDNDGGIMKLHDELFLHDHTDSAFQLAPLCPPVSLVGDNHQWKPINMDQQARSSHQNWSKLSVATYNILHDPAFPISTRIDMLIEDILNADADILCLQEVTDQSMSLLLSSPPIQRVYQHSSRDPAVVLENERNVLVLSKYPFTPKIIDTGTRHKPATIAIFDSPRSGPETESTSLVVVAIHLTAGRAAVPLDQKTRELQGVISYLRSNHPNDDWIVAGDMNWPNEIETTPMEGSNVFDDAVVTLKGSLSGQNNDAGQRQVLDFATYDPVHNPLAAQTARESKVGQRYDRIYVKRTENLVICDVEMFGIRDDPASDHWGLKAQLTNPLLEPTPTDNVIPTHGDIEGANCDPVEEEALEPATITQEDLDDLFLKRTWLPDEAQEQDMAKALSILRQVICTSNSDTSATLANNDQTDQPSAATPITSTAPKVLIKLEAVGSYALGVHTNHSDIDCLAVGNISPRTFWLLAQSRIRSQGKKLGPTQPNEDEIVKLKRFVKDAAVQMMELEVLGIKIDLQYCAAARLAERWDDIARLPTDSPLFSLPVASLVTLNAYRDVLTIKRLVPSLPTFRTAHRALKLLLSDRGLVGARFGYLGGFHLTLLLTSIALHLPRSATAPHLVEKFLHTYAEWNWERDVVYPIPSLANRVNYKRTLTKEPMVVLSIEKPHSNLTYHASWNSVTSLSRGFKDAHTILSSGGSWKNICGENPLEEFINGHKAFIKLDVHFWGGDCMKGRAVIGWLESRVVSVSD
ncbi:hypothetical protein FRC19_007592 [Serendipita sp. 401]|nr:hypothetical protein FRC19_007592 [Serendipita sp. 401]